MAIIGVSGKINSGKDLVGNIIKYLINESKITNAEQYPLSFEAYCDTITIEDDGSWKIVKWADKLKDIVCIILGCTRKQLEDRDFKEKELSEEWWYFIKATNIGTKELVPYLGNEYMLPHAIIQKSTPRKLLQLLGTECGRQIIHPNIWVNATIIDYKPTNININLEGWKYPNWIITDTRFPNEADAIKDRKGINIRLQREKVCNICDKTIRKQRNGCNEITCPKGRPDYIKPSLEHESETALDFYKFDYVIDNNGTIEELIDKVKEILIKEKII